MLFSKDAGSQPAARPSSRPPSVDSTLQRCSVHATARRSARLHGTPTWPRPQPTACELRREGNLRRTRPWCGPVASGARAQPSRRARPSAAPAARLPLLSHCSSPRLNRDSPRPSLLAHAGATSDRIAPVPRGRAGSVRALGFGVNTIDPRSAPIAGIRTTDTALTKAGVADGGGEKRHGKFARSTAAGDRPAWLRPSACPPIQQVPIQRMSLQEHDVWPNGPFTVKSAFQSAMARVVCGRSLSTATGASNEVSNLQWNRPNPLSWELRQ